MGRWLRFLIEAALPRHGHIVSELARDMRQKRTFGLESAMHKLYGLGDYLLGQTGTAERSANVLITARRPAVLHGWRSSIAFQTGAPELDDLRATLTGRPTACCRVRRATRPRRGGRWRPADRGWASS